MKKVAVLLTLLLAITFLAGCAQQPQEKAPEEGTGEEEQVTELSEQEENQELEEFSSTLISEEDEIDIGDIV